MDLRNCDNMELMAQFEDNYFDLAICDPPYGIRASNYTRGGTRYGNSAAVCKTYALKDWDNQTPDKAYFDELMRVSKNQIIWGGNYFANLLPNSRCWIVWDKQTAPNNGYADCELAWTSFDTAVRKVQWRWSGMLQQNMSDKEERIHPTQKPKGLYYWLLHKYAKNGWKILDTHLGSGSIAIACHYAGFDLTACEIDKEYYEKALKRIAEETAQTELLFNH